MEDKELIETEDSQDKEILPIDTTENVDESSPEESGRIYSFANLFGQELPDDVYQAILPKLEEYKTMGFTQEQVEYLVLDDLLEEIEDNPIIDPKSEINSKLSKEEKLAWKSTGVMIAKKVGKELSETVKKMMFNPEMFKVLYIITKGNSEKNEGKSITDIEKMAPKKSEEELYDDYISEIRDVLGNTKKIKEIKDRWLKEHPELNGKIR